MRVTRRAFSRSRFTRTFFGIPAVREHSRIRGVCKYRWRLERKVDTTTSNFRRSARKRKKHTAARNKITGCYERPVEKPSPRERERERGRVGALSQLCDIFSRIIVIPLRGGFEWIDQIFSLSLFANQQHRLR